LVVVVAIVAHKEALAKEMTLAASWLVVAISLFGIGWSCGYDHNGKSSTCKVFVYKKLGKCYDALTCTVILAIARIIICVCVHDMSEKI
jgi:hypothetical protein